MSNVNVRRAVENIRGNTTVFTPIVEVIVNAIQAIDAKGLGAKGHVQVRAIRHKQKELDGSLPDIVSVQIEDNGIGFTDENRESFDTLYSDLKIKEGGKGFGRFVCLKYFENLLIESDFRGVDAFLHHRSFRMGKGKDIIIDETVADSTDGDSRSVVTLEWLKEGKSLEKKLDTIARILVEKLLPYFITAGYTCPTITLSEDDGSDAIILNNFVNNQISDVIQEIPLNQHNFELKSGDAGEFFNIRLFRIFFPKSAKSRVSLIAHKREVSSSSLHDYVPEFSEEFFEKRVSSDGTHSRNYIVKAYVSGPFLDEHVSVERGGFDLEVSGEPLYGISQSQIEKVAADVAKEALGSEVLVRQEKKREHVRNYVDESAPWHKSLLNSIDLSSLPYNPSSEEIELRFQKEKYRIEIEIRKEVIQVLAAGGIDESETRVTQLVEAISEASKNDLVHYIAQRRNVLDLFEKSLEIDAAGKYQSEGFVHDIIFPRRGDTEFTPFKDHNLWIIDERLNFTNYLSSDVPLNGDGKDRPDLAAYNRRIVFRGDNEASNPITVFEFKKPHRDDFVNPSSKEDPVQQIVRYVISIQDGKFETPKGRRMLVADNTPFYGYVVCELTSKVEEWLLREKNFKPMPDKLGWFQWIENLNLYVEVLSWEKVLRDAQLRNKIFFHHLSL